MTSDTLGGVWIYSLDLIRELASLGIDVSLATMGNALSRDQRQTVNGIRNLHLYESQYRLEWMNDPWSDVKKAGDWLMSIAEKTKPDLIHFNNYCHVNLEWKAPKLVVAHSDVASWWSAVRKEPLPPTWNRYRTEVTRGLQSADIVITPSRSALSDIQKNYGPIEKVRVIPNGRDQTQFNEQPKENFILSVGRIWDASKNIKILNQIAEETPWPIYVAGETFAPNGNQTQYSALKTLGVLKPEQVSDYYGRAAIYALPAVYEPFGLSVLEAALSGCALVLGDIPSLRENWEDAAIFVNPEDSNELKNAFSLLIQNESKRKEIARNAKVRAKAFSAKRMASLYLQEYSALLKGH